MKKYPNRKLFLYKIFAQNCCLSFFYNNTSRTLYLDTVTLRITEFDVCPLKWNHANVDCRCLYSIFMLERLYFFVVLVMRSNCVYSKIYRGINNVWQPHPLFYIFCRRINEPRWVYVMAISLYVTVVL